MSAPPSAARAGVHRLRPAAGERRGEGRGGRSENRRYEKEWDLEKIVDDAAFIYIPRQFLQMDRLSGPPMKKDFRRCTTRYNPIYIFLGSHLAPMVMSAYEKTHVCKNAFSSSEIQCMGMVFNFYVFTFCVILQFRRWIWIIKLRIASQRSTIPRILFLCYIENAHVYTHVITSTTLSYP